MKKLLVFLVIVLLLAGGGYLAVTRPWEAARGNETATAPAAPLDSEPLPTPTVEPAQPTEPAGPTVLPGLDAEIQLAAGWAIQPGAPEAEVIPGGEAVVLRPGAAKLPLLIVGRLGAEQLGKADPAAYPTAFIAALQSRLGKVQPTPNISRAGVVEKPPPLLSAGQELIASGSFPSFGVDQGSGRFLAGTSADHRVYLVISLAQAQSDAERASDDMIASLAPVARLIPAEPASPSPAPAAEEPPPAAPPGEIAPAAEPAPAAESLGPAEPTTSAQPKSAPAPPKAEPTNPAQPKNAAGEPKSPATKPSPPKAAPAAP